MRKTYVKKDTDNLPKDSEYDYVFKKNLIDIVALSLFILSSKVFASGLPNNHEFAFQAEKRYIPSPLNNNNNNKLFKEEELLFIQVFERQELWDDLSRTKFYVLNPAEKKTRFIQIFEGPGESQYFHFLTPLFNGWGIAYGRVGKNFEPDRPELFWFNAFTGEKGPIIHKRAYKTSIFKDCLIFFSGEGLNRYHLKSGNLVHIPIESQNGGFHVVSPNEIIKNDLIFFSDNGLYRYHLESGKLFYIPIKLITYQIISSHKFFAEIEETKERYLIELDICTFDIKKIAKIPSGIHRAKTDLLTRYSRHIGMAGKEGVFIVNGYSLWFKPSNREWTNVVKDVPIVGLRTATIPNMPVSYLGNGKFAVTKSVKKEIETTKENKADEYKLPEYSAVTMLVDGYTGKIIEKGEPEIYEVRPRSNIPDNWLTEEQLARRRECFKTWQINNKIKSKRTIKLDGGYVYKLAKRDKVSRSKNNRFVAIYRNWSSDWADDANYLNFKIIEKQTGRTRDFRINTSKKVLKLIYCDWLMVTDSESIAEKIEKANIKNNIKSIRGSWHDPMVWDPAIH